MLKSVFFSFLSFLTPLGVMMGASIQPEAFVQRQQLDLQSASRCCNSCMHNMLALLLTCTNINLVSLSRLQHALQICNKITLQPNCPTACHSTLPQAWRCSLQICKMLEPIISQSNGFDQKEVNRLAPYMHGSVICAWLVSS